MVILVVVFVGSVQEWIDELVEKISEVKFGVWNDENVGFGFLISVVVKQCV